MHRFHYEKLNAAAHIVKYMDYKNLEDQIARAELETFTQYTLRHVDHFCSHKEPLVH